MWIANADRSRIVDQLAEAEFGLTSNVLMERAGCAVFDVVREVLPRGGRIVVQCGKGHNGGDGFVVARLAREAGYGVDCLVAATEADLKPSTREQCELARAAGVEPIFSDEPRWSRRQELIGCRDLVVDALLGSGGEHSVTGPIRTAIEAINRSGVPVLSVDVPSGIHCDTGEELGESIWAMRTVAIGQPKPYLFQGLGLEHAGFWTVADIGYPDELLEDPTDARLLDAAWVGNLLPERRRASHKGENGNVLVVAGSGRMRGAAVLAAKGALRAGAGLVTVAGVKSVLEAVAAQIPEALLFPLPERDGVISADSAKLLIDSQNRYFSCLFGPGMTHEEPALEFLKKVWSEWTRPTVVDADALNAVALGVPLPRVPCVLTPHPGEMSRLLELSIAECQADRFHTVRHAVSKFGQCVLLKGPYSIVGDHGQPMAVNCTGNPGMASGGMGDVLTGIIATLMAQELPPYYAASCAMYWHGLAADHCANQIGPIGFSARDVALALPAARAKITASCES